MSDDFNLSIGCCLLQIRKSRSIKHVEELYDLTAVMVRHIGAKYLHDTTLTDDFVQDFFADIFSIADGFSFLAHGRAYICKVATRRAINAYKKEFRKNATILYVDYDNWQFPDPDSEIVHLRLHVGEALKTLTEMEKIIIQETYFEEKTTREIAKDLHMSKSTVGRLKLSALDKLKVFLERGEKANNGR